MSEKPTSTDDLQQAMVASLMSVIVAPDDPVVARDADAVTREVEQRMREESRPA